MLHACMPMRAVERGVALQVERETTRVARGPPRAWRRERQVAQVSGVRAVTSVCRTSNELPILRRAGCRLC